MDNAEAMLTHLAQDAENLAGKRDLPIDPIEILSDLGLGLRVESGAANRRVGGLRRLESGWEVLLVRQEPRDAELTQRDRFTIAHEIGHYLVAARFSFKPQSNREYWALEEVCNDFARLLLAPRAALAQVLSNEPSSARHLAQMAQSLSELAQISLEPAARRITGELRRRVFVSFLEVDRGDSTEPDALVLWTVQNYPWGPKGRNKKLDPTEPLAAAVPAARELRHRESAELTITATSSAWVQRRGRYAVVAGLISQS
jgi:hypothetical protein